MLALRLSPIVISIVALCAAGSCWARVGVTSATAGDPVGQPPAEQERILRVGIDVQASEKVTTKNDDRAHLVFLDGTSVTIGPNSALTIDKFVYDPDAKKGELSIGAAKGVFRLVGGNISKGGNIEVTTPSASIGIRGGIMTFEVGGNGSTNSNFLYGESMKVTAQGETQTATREGSTIHVEMGGHPSPPAIIPPHGFHHSIAFEKSGGSSVTTSASSRNASVGKISEALSTSTLSHQNSQAKPTVVALSPVKGGPSNTTIIKPVAVPKPVPKPVVHIVSINTGKIVVNNGRKN